MRSVGAAILGPALLAMLATRTVAAQAPASNIPPAGTRVRIAVLGRPPRVGTLVGKAGDSLVVGWSSDGRETFAIRDVSSLDISRGTRRHVMRGAVIGLALGTIGGLVKTMSANDDASRTRFQNYETCTTGGGCDSLDGSIAEDHNRKIVPIGIAIGTTVGALLGLIATEQWRPAADDGGNLRVGIAPVVSPRHVSLAFSAHF